MAKPVFVRDETGREVFGLRTQPSDRRDANGKPIIRYYSKAPDGSRVYHGDSRDRAVAICRFRSWKAAQGGQTVPIQTGAVDTLPTGGPVAFHLAGNEVPNARRLMVARWELGKSFPNTSMLVKIERTLRPLAPLRLVRRKATIRAVAKGR